MMQVQQLTVWQYSLMMVQISGLKQPSVTVRITLLTAATSAPPGHTTISQEQLEACINREIMEMLSSLRAVLGLMLRMPGLGIGLRITIVGIRIRVSAAGSLFLDSESEIGSAKISDDMRRKVFGWAVLQLFCTLLAGGNWNNASNARSQYRNANNYRWNTNSNISSRFT